MKMQATMRGKLQRSQGNRCRRMSNPAAAAAMASIPPSAVVPSALEPSPVVPSAVVPSAVERGSVDPMTPKDLKADEPGAGTVKAVGMPVQEANAVSKEQGEQGAASSQEEGGGGEGPDVSAVAGPGQGGSAGRIPSRLPPVQAGQAELAEPGPAPDGG